MTRTDFIPPEPTDSSLASSDPWVLGDELLERARTLARKIDHAIGELVGSATALTSQTAQHSELGTIGERPPLL
jgi:hypothetical protein